MKIKAELIFPGELKDKAIIWYVCKNFDIVLNILEASFSTDTGWAILFFEGSNENIQRTFKYLLGKKIEIKDTQVIA